MTQIIRKTLRYLLYSIWGCILVPLIPVALFLYFVLYSIAAICATYNWIMGKKSWKYELVSALNDSALDYPQKWYDSYILERDELY